MVGGMVEKQQGAPATTAAGAAYAIEPWGLTLKGMVLSGTAERPDGSYAFSVAKLAALKAVDQVQLGASVEVPLKVPADSSSAPKLGWTMSINLG